MKIIYIWILCLFGSTLQATPKKVTASKKTSSVQPIKPEKQKDTPPVFYYDGEQEDVSLAVNHEVKHEAVQNFSGWKEMQADAEYYNNILSSSSENAPPFYQGEESLDADRIFPSLSENSPQFQDEQASPERNSSQIKKNNFSKEQKISIMASLWHQPSAKKTVGLKSGVNHWLPAIRTFFHTVRSTYPNESKEQCKELIISDTSFPKKPLPSLNLIKAALDIQEDDPRVQHGQELLLNCLSQRRSPKFKHSDKDKAIIIAALWKKTKIEKVVLKHAADHWLKATRTFFHNVYNQNLEKSKEEYEALIQKQYEAEKVKNPFLISLEIIKTALNIQEDDPQFQKGETFLLDCLSQKKLPMHKHSATDKAMIIAALWQKMQTGKVALNPTATFWLPPTKKFLKNIYAQNPGKSTEVYETLIREQHKAEKKKNSALPLLEIMTEALNIQDKGSLLKGQELLKEFLSDGKRGHRDSQKDENLSEEEAPEIIRCGPKKKTS